MDNLPQQQNPQENCIFCQIATKKIPSKVIYEDDLVIGVLDINPANKGHVLLLTKKHYSLMMQIPDDELSHLMLASKKISFALLKALNIDGTNIFIANGQTAGQKAPHFILHIIPRFENDNINFSLYPKIIDKNILNDAFLNIKKSVDKNFGLKNDTSQINKPQKEQNTNNVTTNITNQNQQKNNNTNNITNNLNNNQKTNTENQNNNSTNIDLDKISNLFK
jgi:histidine triad (HIT) family protein